MIRRHANLRRRQGTIVVLTCVMMIVLLAMVAFAIDLSYFANSQTELQRCADATALAACYELLNQSSPGAPVSVSANVANVPAVASQYAGLNLVCRSAPALPGSDVVVGNMADPTHPSTINTSAAQGNFNAVQVTVRRTASENGLIASFFGRAIGSQGASASATATAAFVNSFNGFQVPSANGGTGSLMILPFALDQQTWNDLQAGDKCDTTDGWSYSQSRGVYSGSDGVREVNLFPEGTGSPGNRGTVNIGSSNNSTATLCRQILSGISASDLAYYPNSQLQFDSSGNLYLNGNTGISAGCKSALASIIGQTRCIPIFTSVVGPGNNATYDIVAWASVRIMDVNLTGSMSSKHLTVQPATLFTSGGIVSTSGTTSSYGLYSPVWLVK